MSLQEIKEGYTKENGYLSCDGMWPNGAMWISAADEIAKRYAKAKLEEAAERATVRYEEIKLPLDEDGIQKYKLKSVVDKKSITETPLD